jgi:hypothetical protein
MPTTKHIGLVLITYLPRLRTYQEGLLARRRLVFTKSQVYFQCQEFHTFEGISAFFETERDIWKSGDNALKPIAKAMEIFPPLSVQYQRTPIEARIREYLQRSLSYESDMLHAFLGVLRQAWHQEIPTYHFWGLPFCQPPTTAGSLDSEFLISLCWSPAHRYAKRPSIRRFAYPSWTWVDWRELIGIDQTSWRLRNEKGDAALQLGGTVRFEDVAGTQTSIYDYISIMERRWNLYAFQPHIHLTAWIAMVHVRRCRMNIDFFSIADASGHVLAWSHIPIVSSEDFTQGLLNPSRKTWPALIIASNASICGLVLRPMKDGTYERLGNFRGAADFLSVSKNDHDFMQVRTIYWRNEPASLVCHKRAIILT